MENCLDQIKNIFSASNKTKLAIIGKGTSITEISLNAVNEDFFTIALNDAEFFLAPDLSIFYRDDLYHSIKSNGFNSSAYISPAKFTLSNKPHIVAEYHSFDQEGFERIYSYFSSEEFYILDFTLLSAIKLAILYQQVKKIAIDVVFIGFDFYLPAVKEGDYQGLEYRNAHLRTQESLFITLLGHVKDKYPLLSLAHIGNKKYSTQTVDEFNHSLTQNTSNDQYLTNKELYQQLIQKVEESNKVVVVAEFTNNHIGDKNRLVKMIELAVESGADIIKVQKRDVSTFYTEEELSSPYQSPFGNTLRAYREAVELTDELFKLLDKECRKRNIPWFASILDWNSYLYIQQFDCPIIKLPSTISNHKNYLKKVANDFKSDIVISTGFTDVDYEQFVLSNMVRDKKLFLLQCTSSYPTPPEGCQLSVVRHYDQLKEKHPNIIPGYSSHDLGSLGCMMAVAAGARMIEKHVKLGDLDWVHFDSVAIDLYNNRFKQFVNDIRKAEMMCGSKTKSILEKEHHKYMPNTKHN